MTIVTERCRNNIRTALKDYKSKVDQAKSRIDQVKRDFGDEAEARERERLEAGLKSAREQAETVIRDSHREAVENTMKWGQLDGSLLTDDAKLLTAGLVDPAEFDRTTLESGLHRHLYAAGEILDVDGDCGGFNLMFAFASGILAGRNAARA